MRHLMSIVVLSVLTVATSAAQQPQQQRASSEAPIDLPAPLARVLRDYEAAWRARDAAALAQLFVDGEVVMPNGCAPVKGRAAVQSCYSGSGGDLSLRALAFATDATVGYIIGEYAPRNSEPAIGRFTLTLRRNASGQWLIVSDMDRAYPRQAPEALPRR
jgi:ketosteroid isomerase-like protein